MKKLNVKEIKLLWITGFSDGESLSFMLDIIVPIFNNNVLQSSKFKDYINFFSDCILMNTKRIY